jgi:hypothetical protein
MNAYNAVPYSLKDTPQWVVWKYETRDGKATKVPYDPKSNGDSIRAKVNDPSTWASFDRAAEVADILSGHDYKGVGFVLHGTHFVGFDFDSVISDGKPEPFVLDILEKLGNPYCEITPSGNGLRTFVEWPIALPAGGRKFSRNTNGEKYGAEIYSGTEGGRYLTVTGRKFSGNGIPKILDMSVAYFMVSQITNEKLKSLWMGDLSEYGDDQSRADLALLSLLAKLFDNNAQKMEWAFSASKLGQRDKWARRQDYRKRTIEKAIGGEKPKSEPAQVSHAEVSEPETPQDVPIADVGIKDMPESVLDGWLGDVCKKRMLEHFPVAYAWTALVTVASALVPVDPAKNGMRCNLFGCPVGPIHSGKSEAIKHAKLLLGIQSPPLLDLMAGSAEMLTSAVEDAGGRSRLYSTDELGHLLEKAQIQNSSFVYLLNRAFYETGFKVRSMEKKKQDIVFNATLSVIGGVVEERFGDLFTSKTTGGFYDRFLFGLCPTGFRYFYLPFEGGAALQINQTEGDPYGEEIALLSANGNQPIPVSLDKSVFSETNRWMRDDDILKNPDCERIVEIAIRVAKICASFDRRPVLYGKDLAPALELARYQARIRHLLKPNPGKTFEGQLFHKFFEFLTMHANDGQWIPRRELFHRTCSHEIGLPVANKTLDAMIVNGDVEELKQPSKSGPPKRFVRIAKSRVQP